MRWLAMPFLRYADFKGRSGRAEFWTFFGLSVAAFLLTVVVTGLSTDTSTVPQSQTPGANASPAGAIGYLFWWIISIVPWFAVQVRRFHDQGRSGWLCLVGAGAYVALGFGAMPLAAVLSLIAMGLMALPGEEAENRFGPPIDSVEECEAAAGEQDSPSADAQLVDIGTVATASNETLTKLELHSDAAEQQREVQTPETLLMADPSSFGNQVSGRSAPISSGDAMPLHVPDDVQSLGNGNYRCGGYIFYSREEAEWHSQRRALAMASFTAAPAASQMQSNETTLAFNEVEAGIHFGRDGNFYYRSNSFWLIEEARAAKSADLLAQQVQLEPSTSPASVPIEHDELEGNAASVSEIPPPLPADVMPEGDGRFSCGGYVFNSLSAAVSYSKRRSTPTPNLINANSTELDDNRPRRGALDQNQTRQEVASHQFRPSSVSGDIPDTSELAKDEGAHNRVSDGAMPSYLPDDVKPESNGRFGCGGYTFNSLEQALSFAKRRNDRGGHSERSVAPFSIVPVPKPPQRSPPKEERSGFFGLGSSAKKQTVAEHWVADATKLSAGGIPFEGYLVYFGTRPRSQQYERHRSLIDPNLDVSNGRDPQGSTFSYWPNYSELRPEARRSYLEWLSAGRSDPSTPIGYVFIYFYGLERRLVKDRSEADAPAIMSELRRLLAIYGDNHSFKNYCSALLDMGELLFGNVEETPTPTLDNRYSWELPIRLRVYLGRKVAAGQTLDANDALCWTLGHPMLYPRTPVTRCFAEFCELWKVRFGEQFPKGLSVREPKARLNFQYRSASSEFSATATVDNLPDVGAISGPISKFELLLGSCSDELDPLSRFLGRNPAEKDSAIAGALLPEPLRENGGPSSFGQFSQFLEIASGPTRFAEVGIPEIMAKLGFLDAGKADERRALHMKRLPELFDAAGFGFEPDKRFGPAPSLSEDLKLCVFPAERGGAVNANRPEYLAARTMAEIAALAARADDMVVDAEIESITSDLISFPEISDLDRSRLRAHALALLANPSKLKAATKRLCELPEKQRQSALASAVRAVLADQRITPSEVRFLEGLYKALGLPQDEVYSRLHSGEIATKPASKSALPPTQGSGREASGPEIDHQKLARLKEETSAVSSMLASIFKDEEAPAKTAVEEPTAGAEFAGLDAAHSSLLIRLTEAPMESDAFEAICRNHKLLPSGAIETINDWAFDALDDFVIEEGELICIQEHLIEPVKAMRKAI